MEWRAKWPYSYTIPRDHIKCFFFSAITHHCTKVNLILRIAEYVLYCKPSSMSSARGPEGCSWRPWEEKILVPFPERHVVPVMHDAHKFSKSHFNQNRNLFESLLYRFFTTLKFQRMVEMQLFSATQNVKNSFLIIFPWLKIRLNTKDSKLLTGLIFLFSIKMRVFMKLNVHFYYPIEERAQHLRGSVLIVRSSAFRTLQTLNNAWGKTGCLVNTLHRVNKILELLYHYFLGQWELVPTASS